MIRKLLFFSALSFFVLRVSAQSSVFAKQGRWLSNSPGEDTIKVNVLNRLSNENHWASPKKSLEYAEQALKLAEHASFERGRAIALYRIADSYWALGEMALAIEKCLYAIDVAEANDFQNVLAECHGILAKCYNDQRDFFKTNLHLGIAEKLSLHHGNWMVLAKVYNLNGIVFYGQNKPDSAMVFYKKALEVAELHPEANNYRAPILANIGECYIKSDKDTAFKFLFQGLDKAAKMNYKSIVAAIMVAIAEAQMTYGSYAEAGETLNEAIRLPHEIGAKRIVRYAYSYRIKLAEKEGKIRQALEYSKKHDAISDSLVNASITRQIVELENTHLANKAMQRVVVLEHEKRIETIWKNVLIVSSLVLIVSLAIIFRLQHLKAKKAKELLETQKILNAKLKETDLLKSRFFANITHEFRTPLSLILAPVEDQLAKAPAHSSDKKYLQIVKNNANRVLELVNQLLDLSKIDAGKMGLLIRQGDLNVFLNATAASFNSLAESKKVQFIKHIDIKSPSTLFDSDKLQKIINNVLMNAFKFTPTNGQVTLLIVDTPEINELMICVSDTGSGIPKEEQPHVFSPFYQSIHSSDNGQLGTGLGLSLVKELVKLYGGKIHLLSDPNEGTSITITLPTFKPEWTVINDDDNISNPVINHNLESITNEFDHIELDNASLVLIAEDNEDLCNFIASCLNNSFNVITAKDGEMAYSLALERVPDVILSDLMMPKLDGIELVERLKSDERTSHIPIVLLTARADNESKMLALRKGADDYLTKPFSAEELTIRIKNLAEMRKKLTARFVDSITDPTPEHHEFSVDEKFLNRAKTIVEQNIGNPNFGVELFAEHMNLSRTQLFRKIKALLNISPSEFVNDIRLQRAANMIRSKSNTLAQISYAVGFNEQSYFAKRFRKKFGMSPSEYAETMTLNV